MALSFPKTIRVKAGDAPTSKQMIALANAWNARVLSGLGDIAWRICMYWFNAFRQVRNSDSEGNTPAMGEFFYLYQLLDPENDPGQWPVAGPGEPEGANVANIVNAFVYGVEAADINSEEFRISDPAILLWANNGPPATLAEWWELGKLQRGVIDADTGAQNVPAIEAAQAGRLILTGGTTPHGKGWGGQFPLPEILSGDCGADESGGAGITSFQIKFTALRADAPTTGYHGTVSTNVDGMPVVTYAGTCPLETDDTGFGHVLTIVRFPTAYYVKVNLGGSIAWDVYPTVDWLEGPYTGFGALYRYDAAHLDRAVWAFDKDFRGTNAQRSTKDWEIENIAFSFQEFHDRQYYLAPNIGVESGGDITAVYPLFKISASKSIPAGTNLKFGANTSHAYRPGFVLSGYYAKAENLVEPVTLEILEGKKTVIHTITLTPEAPEVLRYLETALTPQKISVRVKEAVKLKGTGVISVEFTEQPNYKPDHWDAYLVLRNMATKGGFSFEGEFLDGSGVDQNNSKGLFDDYARYGCIVNTTAAGVRSQAEAISPNPVYDALRRLSRDMMRIIRHQEFLSYKVENGKAVFRFKRYAFGLKKQRADIWHGIAGSYNTVPEVLEGIEYVVRSHTGGTITYAGATMGHGKRFIGQPGESTYTVQGDAKCLEYNGIRSVAPKGGWSNEHCMFIETRVMNPSTTSVWNETYQDWWVFTQRCHFYAYNLPPALARFADLYWIPDARLLHLSPEAPSGYNYSFGANSTASDDFCRSCQIYKAPYEIESAITEFSPSGDDIVEITLKGRMQTHPDAALSFSDNAATWNVADIRAESYRTDDNAIREYRLWMDQHILPSWKTGDGAALNYSQGLPDQPYGSIIPTFFTCALAKKPFEDGNDTPEEHDTRMTIDELLKLETAIKAGCEGCVDGVASKDVMCGTNTSPYDYVFENLIFNVSGKRQIGRGHGPQVNTYLDADTFNQLAACVDELNQFRIDGILTLELRKLTHDGFFPKALSWGSTTCFEGPGNFGYWEGSPDDPPQTGDTGWLPSAGGFTLLSNATLGGCDGSGSFVLYSKREEIQYRFVADGSFQFALPSNVSGLISGNHIALIGVSTRTKIVPTKTATDISGADGCGPVATVFWDGSTGYTFGASIQANAPECQVLTSGSFKNGTAPGGAFSVGSVADASAGAGYSWCGTTSTDEFQFIPNFENGFTGRSAILTVPLVEVES